MRTLIWCGTLLVTGLWSLLAWALHGMVGLAGSALESGAGLIPLDPLLGDWAEWIASAGTGIGEWLVVALWAIGALVLLVLGFVATRFATR